MKEKVVTKVVTKWMFKYHFSSFYWRKNTPNAWLYTLKIYYQFDRPLFFFFLNYLNTDMHSISIQFYIISKVFPSSSYSIFLSTKTCNLLLVDQNYGSVKSHTLTYLVSHRKLPTLYCTTQYLPFSILKLIKSSTICRYLISWNRNYYSKEKKNY